MSTPDADSGRRYLRQIKHERAPIEEISEQLWMEIAGENVLNTTLATIDGFQTAFCQYWTQAR